VGLQLAGRHIARAARAIPGSHVLVQARGATAACAALEAKRRVGTIAVLFDARADGVAEARLEGAAASTPAQRRRWARRARRREVLQRRAAANADFILAVSKPLRDKLCTIGNVPHARVTVVPCCVNLARFPHPLSTRESIRRRLHLEDRFVFVYSGSLALWQIPERIAALMKAIRAQMPTAHLLILTRDRHAGARFFGELVDHGVATIEDCPFESVGDYLGAADAALLLREDNPVNRVSCPVKFAEYLVSGLPVIATPGIGDVSDYIRETGHGVLIRLNERLEQQAEQVTTAVAYRHWPPREAIRSRAIESFSRESYRQAYEDVLAGLGVALNGRRDGEPRSQRRSAR